MGRIVKHMACTSPPVSNSTLRNLVSAALGGRAATAEPFNVRALAESGLGHKALNGIRCSTAPKGATIPRSRSAFATTAVVVAAACGSTGRRPTASATAIRGGHRYKASTR